MRGWMILNGMVSTIGGTSLFTGQPSASMIAVTVFSLLLLSLAAVSLLVRGRP